MERKSTLTIGENRGAPRLWIEGKYLAQFGFEKGCSISLQYEEGAVVIRREDGGRKVAGRRNRPIIDVNTQRLAAIFQPSEKVLVTITEGVIRVDHTDADRIRVRPKDKTAGSVFSGGGLLDQAVAQAGFRTVFGIEVNEDYADVWQQNYGATMHQMCVSDAARIGLPSVELLTMGIPCQPFSKARRQAGNAKRSSTSYADHELADMTFFAAMMINAVNPRTVIIEEVPGYIDTDLCSMLQQAMRRMDYRVDSRIISGTDYGALQGRERCVILGTTDDDPVWPEPTPLTRTMADILHDPDDPRCEWWDLDTPEKAWWFAAEAKHRAKGNGFIGQRVTPRSTSVQGIPKRYFAGQGGTPVVYDEQRDRYRWLTVEEVKALMELPEDYYLGHSKTLCGEVLGQGVITTPFARIVEANT